jgi:hypothetical protein
VFNVRAWSLLGIVLGIAAGSRDVSAGAQQSTFAARSELVVLHVAVRSGRDGYVTDLPREAFAVVKDSRPQLVSLLADGNEPVVTRHGNRRLLREIASATGGESVELRHAKHVADVLGRIARDLRHAYTIGYVPGNTARDGGFRRVHVTASDPRGPRLDVRSRGGYLTGLPQEAPR